MQTVINIRNSFYIIDDKEIISIKSYSDKGISLVLHIPSNSILECNGFGEMNGSKTIICSHYINNREVLYKECKRIVYSFNKKDHESFRCNCTR